MDLLPNAGRAVVDLAKLRDYRLDPRHLDGKHKARVFQAALGIGRADATWLRQELNRAAQTMPCRVTNQSAYGRL